MAVALSFIDCVNRRDVPALGRLLTEDHVLQVFDEARSSGTRRVPISDSLRRVAERLGRVYAPGVDDQEQVAWTAMPYRAPVTDRSGAPIGTTESLLGDEEADIFHGIVVRRRSDQKLVEVAAAHVLRITRHEVATDLEGPAATAELPEHQEERWAHLGWGGLFRRRPEWRDRG